MLHSNKLLVFFLFFTALVFSQQTYLDTFSSVSYSNNDGTDNFSSNWIEANDDGTAGGGNIRITGGRLRFRDLDNRWIYRRAPLAGASAATFTMDYDATSRGDESLLVYIWNPGAGTFNLIANINTSNTGSISYNLTAAEIASNPRVLLYRGDTDWGGSETIFVDNVQFSATFNPAILVDDITVNEAAGTATFTARHNGADTSGTFSVNFQTQNGSASSGSDYTFSSGTLNFNGTVGDTETITVPILNNPGVELNETFTIVFTGSSDPSVDFSDTATGTIVEPNNPRAYEERYAMNLTGNFKVLSNTNLECVSNCPGTPTTNNPSVVMGYADVDADGGTVNSSSATLTLPAGATVTWAGLYWGGLYGSTNSGITNPTGLNSNEIKFRTPGSTAYTTINADIENVENSSFSGWTSYLAFADVTTFVQSGGSGDYFAADIALATGSSFTGPYGGWNLVVVYEDLSENSRNIAIWDGFDFFGFGANDSFTVTGLLTPSTGAFETHAAYFAFDGEANRTGDFVSIEGTALTNGLNPADNTLNGTISEFGVDTGARNPNYPYSWGIDSDVFDASGFVANNATDMDVTLGSSNEGVWGGVFVTSNEIAFPAVASKIFTPSTIFVGDESTVSITVDNPSNGVSLTNFSLTDNLPAGMTLSASPDASSSCGGSITASSGASVFSVTGVSLPAGSSCTFTFDVIASSDGTYDNTISPSDITNDQNIPISGESTGTLTVMPLLDSDNDGVADVDDLDDDNDGILDAHEENCGPDVAGFDAYWNLENSTDDTSGNNYDATAGSVSYSTDSRKGLRSASFNGTSNYLRYSDGTFLNQQITDFTYSFWIKPSDLSGIQTLLDEGGGTNGIGIRLNGNTLENSIREGGAGSQVSTTSFTFPNDDRWHHIGFTYANGDVVMYFDGVASPVLSTGFGQLAAHGSAHAFGRSDGDSFGEGTGNYYEGLMDEIVHYPIALSQTQMQAMYEGTCDTDNDLTINRLDDDSDFDGCSDADEAYGNAGTDADDNGFYGSGTPTVDGEGRVVGAPYTEPVDTDGNGIYDFLESGGTITITGNPQDQNVADGSNAVFIVTASGTNLRYQWQQSSNGGVSYTDIGGATSASLTIVASASNDGNFYRVIVSNPNNICSTVTSSSAILTIVSDFDNDGVVDTDDLDDDNDGILDTVEANNCDVGDPTVDVIIFSEDFGTANGNRVTTPYTNYDFEDGTGSAGVNADLQDGEYTIFENISATAAWAPSIWQTQGDHTTGSDRMMIVNANNTAGLEFYRRQLVKVTENVPLSISFWVMNLDTDIPGNNGRTEPDITVLIQQGGSTVYTFDTNSVAREPDGSPNAWKNFTGSFTPTTDTALEIVLINNAPGGGGNDLALDDIEILQSFCDSDGDGTPNSMQADSDGDGCNDSDEAYADPNADTDDNGMYGTGIPSVNADGTVVSASYQTPEDADSNGVYDFQEAGSSPTISVHPQNQNAEYGDDVTFSVTHDGTDTSYQWQVSTDGGTTFNNISGATNASLTVSYVTANEDGNQYRVIVAESAYICSETTSNPGELSVTVPDFDADGSPDLEDLDDDNDGIPDDDEGCLTYAQSVASQSGVGNPSGILGSPDNSFAEIYTDGDVITIDFQREFPAGTKYIFTWQRRPGRPGETARSIVSESADNSTFTLLSFYPDTSVDAVVADTITSENNFRYLRFSKQTVPSVTDYQIDAVEVISCVIDSDGDGQTDNMDLDSDNDGIYDVVEAGHDRPHTSGIINGTFGGNGLSDLVETSSESGVLNYSIVNTDSSGSPDFQDIDSDDDGCSDANEAYADLNADGGDNEYYGTGNPPSIDGMGRVTAATYPVPADGDSNSTFDYREAESAPSITTQPTDSSACPGDNTTFEVIASNSDTYQWQLFSGGVWTDLSDAGIHSGTDSPTLTITNAQISDNGNEYRVIVSNSSYICSTETSNQVTLTVAVPVVNAGSDQEICDSESVTLTASASGGTPGYSYLWNTGQTTASITFAPTGNPNMDISIDYTVTVTDNNGCQDTDTVRVRIESNPTVTVSTSPASCGIDNGEITFSFPDHPNRTGIEFSLDNQATYESSVNDNSGSVTYNGLAAGTYRLWARWGNNECPVDLGNHTISDTPQVSIDTQPADQTVFVNDNAIFSVTTSNADTYQWQVSTDDGGSFTDIADGTAYSGTQTATLTVNAAEQNQSGYRFRVIASNSATSCAPFISNNALLTVNVKTVITNRRITYRVKKD